MPTEIIEILGYEFTNRGLLTAALTHRSSCVEVNYERLEFLGDRVLGLVIADLLMETFPKENEGDLSQRYHALVRKESLANIAHNIGLPPLIRMGHPEHECGGRENEAIIADVLEALLGAVYLDGGLAPAKKIITQYFMPAMSTNSFPPQDAKTTLQEWLQSKGLGLPNYTLIEQKGPDHQPTFIVAVTAGQLGTAEGIGKSKRAAEQEAAANMLADLTNG